MGRTAQGPGIGHTQAELKTHLYELLDGCRDMFTAPISELPNTERRVYASFSDLSLFVKRLRSRGLPPGDASRCNQFHRQAGALRARSRSLTGSTSRPMVRRSPGTDPAAMHRGTTVEADEVDRAFAEACQRLFELHANGFKRPRPTARQTGLGPASITAAQRFSRQAIGARAGTSII